MGLCHRNRACADRDYGKKKLFCAKQKHFKFAFLRTSFYQQKPIKFMIFFFLCEDFQLHQNEKKKKKLGVDFPLILRHNNKPITRSECT